MLASMGVTFLVSSGDDGVMGNGAGGQGCIAACTTSSSTNPLWSGTSWTGTGYFPDFPASCPYVTAVGATMGSTNVVPNVGESERACQVSSFARYALVDHCLPCYTSYTQSQLGGVITSGGGFSGYFAQPSWQTSAVTNYFTSLGTSPASGYNRNGRGYPDVSFLGVSYEVVDGGQLGYYYGTSCSSPAFAGMSKSYSYIQTHLMHPT